MKIYYHPVHNALGLSIEGRYLRVDFGYGCRTFMMLTEEWIEIGEL